MAPKLQLSPRGSRVGNRELTFNSILSWIRLFTLSHPWHCVLEGIRK